jgi:hypothetical protein
MSLPSRIYSFRYDALITGAAHRGASGRGGGAASRVRQPQERRAAKSDRRGRGAASALTLHHTLLDKPAQYAYALGWRSPLGCRCGAAWAPLHIVAGEVGPLWPYGGRLRVPVLLYARAYDAVCGQPSMSGRSARRTAASWRCSCAMRRTWRARWPSWKRTSGLQAGLLTLLTLLDVVSVIRSPVARRVPHPVRRPLPARQGHGTAPHAGRALRRHQPPGGRKRPGAACKALGIQYACVGLLHGLSTVKAALPWGAALGGRPSYQPTNQPPNQPTANRLSRSRWLASQRCATS